MAKKDLPEVGTKTTVFLLLVGAVILLGGGHALQQAQRAQFYVAVAR
ncbi:MAG: hypothetical protein P4L81_07345 [Candidatus Pacebacteria bacterium]|nr:hypothetical protein [Candidatus Paceibacterota bacterium]